MRKGSYSEELVKHQEVSGREREQQSRRQHPRLNQESAISPLFPSSSIGRRRSCILENSTCKSWFPSNTSTVQNYSSVKVVTTIEGPSTLTRRRLFLSKDGEVLSDIVTTPMFMNFSGD